ncbi:hypothetical protein [Micromonospora antibiotica]|uniref:Gram-positive cocci surface proteins LPxTG domain-containing protein n=1 Tax=Micromonospora antibiotica TaxID=2807623 RepID=A0ABS3V1P0_9ACTN|nr:hypothetical protein [Micromonospora antibiotica]MBO4159518.1 hypothetical protein [Micromonospora antibiotica]
MAMVNLPAARRHHRSRIRYAFGLLALIGAVITVAVVTHYPATSATRLAEPVPAPEITVVGQGDLPAGDPAAPTDPGSAAAADAGSGAAADAAAREPADPGPGGPADAAAGPTADPNGAQSGAGGGTSTLTEPRRPSDDPQTVAQSLFYSGLLGLAISLAGLGLVGTRRRMW